MNPPPKSPTPTFLKEGAMTTDAYILYDYIFQERIGILTQGEREPTFEEIEMAKADADEAVRKLKP